MSAAGNANKAFLCLQGNPLSCLETNEKSARFCFKVELQPSEGSMTRHVNKRHTCGSYSTGRRLGDKMC